MTDAATNDIADPAVCREVDLRRVRDARGPEWLLANGRGGYASGTVRGPPTRRYHALLAAALPGPLGRSIMLNHLRESIATAHGVEIDLADVGTGASAAATLCDFHLEDGLPLWRYEVHGTVIEKTVCMSHGQNTVHVIYRLAAGPAIALCLRPYVKFRGIEAPVDMPMSARPALCVEGPRYELSDGHFPPLRMLAPSPAVTFTTGQSAAERFDFALETARGYDGSGLLWCPGVFRFELGADASACLSVSTEAWTLFEAHPPAQASSMERQRRRRLIERARPGARRGLAAELVLAADQFVITPAPSPQDEPAATFGGAERSVIAGYHWFTDWGRDTMISLEGLTLVTGRPEDARRILCTFAGCVRDGLIPNLFPEGARRALYNTADATLWFFHALGRYLDETHDRTTLRRMLPTLMDIFEHHVRGTRFGIGIDTQDGLLHQGAAGYQLTWMDAKVGDWVVTPRRGKAVEINALWYNALRLLERWLHDEGEQHSARRVCTLADQAGTSFNRRFWYEKGGYLYDVVDGEHGDDASCRPNQIFSLSLAHPVLDPSRWTRVLDVVAGSLLTPRGLRTLAPDDARFTPRYDGDRQERDAAYHQGTVWPWLIGAYIDARLRVHPDDRAAAHHFLQGFSAHLSEAGVGFASEIFDAEPPYRPRGCIAQAWSVAELLRSLINTAP